MAQQNIALAKGLMVQRPGVALSHSFAAAYRVTRAERGRGLDLIHPVPFGEGLQPSVVW